MRSEHDPIEQVKQRLIEKNAGVNEEERRKSTRKVRDIVADSAVDFVNDPELDSFDATIFCSNSGKVLS